MTMRLPGSLVLFSVAIPICSSAAAQLPVPRMSTPGGRLSTPIAMCKSNQLSLATDDENGNFNGMSQSGTLVVLRNISEVACRLNAVPRITFADNTRTLDARGQMPAAAFMHPGPVVLPVTLPSGAEVTSTLHWVSGEVFSSSVCVESTKISVEIDGQQQTVPYRGHLCGEAAKGVTFQMTRFATDPTLGRAQQSPADSSQ